MSPGFRPCAPTTTAAAAYQEAPKAGTNPSYILPALEILGFEILLNQYDRHFDDEAVYATDAASIRQNLGSSWIMDDDPFGVNQLGHPYTGATYHGFARSAGLGYWESAAYTFVGSALWEVAGETGAPSLNDQITTGIGGSFLGEAFYRSALWLLEGSPETPSFGNKVGAALLSPPMAFNRIVLGERFFPTNNPAVFSRVGIGAKANSDLLHPSRPDTADETDAVAGMRIDYGIPGRAGYSYTRPFDQFHLEIVGLSDPDNHFDRLVASGLLFGREYRGGADLQGVWGLYGSYDYESPGVFRVASTTLSMGTTVQSKPSSSLTVFARALGGFGYGAAGTVADDLMDRDYHYGTIPQALVDLRAILEERLMFELTGRGYFVIGTGYDHNGGSERISQVEAALTFRIYGGNSLRVEYSTSTRNSTYRTDPDKSQSVATISLQYSYVGGTGFGNP